MRRFNLAAMFLLFFIAIANGSPPSEFRAGMNISANRLTGMATSTLTINSNTATNTRILQLQASGSTVLEVMRNGPLKVNQITALSGVGLKIGSDTAVAAELPEFTTAQRNAISPTNGMIIFNSTTSRPQVYTGGSWSNLVPASGTTVHHLLNFRTVSPRGKTPEWSW